MKRTKTYIPRAKWRDRRNPEPILKNMSEYISPTKGGLKYSHSGFWKKHDDQTILQAMIAFPNQLTTYDKNKVFEEGLNESLRNGDFSKSEVLRQINRALKKHLAYPTQPYFLITSINIRIPDEYGRISILGCHFKFLDSLPRSAKAARQQIVDDKIFEEPEHYSYLRVRTNGRSVSEATDMALKAVNLLLGILNLSLNSRAIFPLSNGQPKPVNVVRLGEFQTLHQLDLSPVPDKIFWYEPEYVQALPVFKQESEFRAIKLHIDLMRNSITKSNYKETMIGAIIRYGDALNLASSSASFILLFSLLELLTDTTRRNYSETISRTLFHFSDRDYTKQALEHLRASRNQSVHEGFSNSNTENDLFQLKYYVERLINFHLFYKPRFKTPKEAGEFMDLPTEKAELRRKKRMIESAIEYIK